jgi:hypothetical protein
VIGWLLARLAEHPQSMFTERELRAVDEAAFERLRAVGLLQRCPISEPGDATVKNGQLVTVSEAPAGGFEGVVEEDISIPPVPLDDQDLVNWEVDLVRLGAEVAARNSLSGPSETIGDRLVLCGHSTSQGLKLAVVLSFAHDEQQSKACYLELSDALGLAFDRLVVLTPGYMPSYEFQRDLRLRRILIALMDDELIVPAAAFMTERARIMPVVELNELEEDERRRHLFKSRDVINLSGVREARHRNVFEVNGVKARLGDAPFAALLLLAGGVFSTEGGWIQEHELLELGEATDIDNLLLRVRTPLRSAPIGCKPTDLIEKDRGRVRLSVHRRFVNFDRGALMRNPSAIIARLAEQLPDR